MSAVPNVPEVVQQTTQSNSEASHTRFEQANGDLQNGQFRLQDHVVENHRPIKVIVIGAGFSGIYCGIRIPERIRNCELVIYEKNAGIGGTWFENRYPGCASDVPSHSYQYSFNPNPAWSGLYAPSSEIRQYLEDTAQKYSVHRFVKLQHQVMCCKFNEPKGKWHVQIRRPDDSEFEDTCDVLISARGNLNHIAWPEIDGLNSFRGEVMHSAKWNEQYDFSNKRVGVIGSGSSAIQIVPNLQKIPGLHLSCFIRGRTWISPPFAETTQEEFGMKSSLFSDEQIQRFTTDPEELYKFRHLIEVRTNEAHAATIKGTEMQLKAQQLFTEHMRGKLAQKPEIFDLLKPDFSPCCRRLTPGPGFLEALLEPNVAFVPGEIRRIESNGVVTADGTLHELDAIVCATGFHVSQAPPFPILGLSSLPLTTHWSARPTTYLSLATDRFPNLLLLLGPNAATGAGSLTTMLEATADYAIRVVRKLQKEGARHMVPRADRVRDFAAYVDAYFARTVFGEECRSWYRAKGRVTGLWPGSTTHCVEALRSPRWEDWEYEYDGEEGGGALAWLGNGWSEAQMGGDAAWYLRPGMVQVPEAPLPERNAEYAVRAFSH